MLREPSQTAMQPLLVTVAIACLLAWTGLPIASVALTVQTKLTRPKTTESVTRILLMEMKSMEVIKNVQVVYWSLSNGN